MQVSPSLLPRRVLDAAHKLSEGKARPALELVGYEGEVERAIQFAFGNTLICQVKGVQGRG